MSGFQLFLFILVHFISLFFFFQAEDGIRDLYVTGVQTCALPIYRAQRLPEAGRARAAIGNLVVLALVLERSLTGPDRAHDLDVLARAREGLAEGLPVPALDHLRAGDPEPQKEAAARELVERGRGRRGHGRRARRHLHDRAAQADRARL